MKRLLLDIGEPDSRHWSIAHARVLLVAGLVLVILAGAAAMYMALRTADADRQVALTFEVRQEARQLFSDM